MTNMWQSLKSPLPTMALNRPVPSIKVNLPVHPTVCVPVQFQAANT